jgi:hypothetical protein
LKPHILIVLAGDIQHNDIWSMPVAANVSSIARVKWENWINMATFTRPGNGKSWFSALKILTSPFLHNV